MSKLWQKSTTDTQSDIAKKVEAFTVGNDYKLDQVLVPYDVRASKVHARALNKAGILSDEELEKLTEALSQVMESWERGEFTITVQDEDMHTAIENFLIAKLGELGKKIHTGRSRNDQVLTAVRLYEKDSLESVLNEVKAFALLLIEFGEKHEKLPMPGYTHTREAMLSSVGLWAGGFAEMLILQIEASAGIAALIDRCPLGTAAGFGTTFDIDREFEAEELGFSGPLICSTTAQLSRGWAELQLVQYLMGITSVLNRFASDVIQFSSEGYPYFDLDEAVCTGSSIMPQKKNPDVAELIRAGHAEVAGAAATLQTITTNLGSGYHRDLQLTKEPVIRSVKKTLTLLQAVQILISGITPNSDNLEQAITKELFAAEAANKLVKEKGVAFREAYQTIAKEIESRVEWTVPHVLKEFTHLGSPGVPGLSYLRDRVEGD
ncbi:argininosuccinate lyase [Rhodohalobacter sp.]|uniref:argininosuccinate lyase n=1 Tax=Rhodohalobacter sp. TaxID=1974210 RepID=UPI002ACD5104|nr:argininosuccinate lyase [Rhodohalobacter sp.]MDZ7754967.1 argininosuccinate lyase [Rhodohalobacter sp.]